MNALCKEWIWVPQDSGLDPLRNRPMMVRTPSSHCLELPCKIDGETMSTATGYGSKIRTRYMVKLGSRWRRVYAACFGNSSTLYVGKPGDWQYTVETITQ